MYDKNQNAVEWKMKWYESLFPVINGLTFPYAIIKGDMLSYWAYGKVGCREYNDIDILISRNNISEIKESLANYGFVSKRKQDLSREEFIRARAIYANSHQISPYYKEIGKNIRPIRLDINYDIFWGEYLGKRILMEEILNETVDVNIYGMNFKSLTSEMAFLQVCLHQYKDMHALYKIKYKNPFQKKRFEEIYFFFKKCIQDDINRFLDMAYKYEIHILLYFVLYYTNKLYDDECLKKCIIELESPDGIDDLEYYGLKIEEKRKWNIPFEKRLDEEDLFKIIEPELTDVDRQKIYIIYNS